MNSIFNKRKTTFFSKIGKDEVVTELKNLDIYIQVAEDKKMRENQSRTKRLAWSNRINVPRPSIPMCLHFYRRSFPVSVGVLQRKQRRIYMPSSFKDNDNL